MATFAQRNLARESVEEDLSGAQIELPEENVESNVAEIEEATGEVDSLEADADQLEEDTAETAAALDQVNEGADGEDLSEGDVDAIEIAQESIVRRWCLPKTNLVQEAASSALPRRRLVQESLGERLKTLWQQFIELLKEAGRKIKDQWVKIFNTGKSVQKKAKAFEAALGKLGSKDKDEISGGFIKALSADGAFQDISALAGWEKARSGALANATKVAEGLAGKVESLQANLSKEEYANEETAMRFLDIKVAAPVTPVSGALLGNKIFKVEGDGDSITIVDSEKDVATEVKTPDVSGIRSGIDFFNGLGKTLEKEITGYRKVESARESVVKKLEAAQKAADKANEDEAASSKHFAILRKIVSRTNNLCNSYDKMAATLATNMVSGVGAYLSTAIGAYKKA